MAQQKSTAAAKGRKPRAPRRRKASSSSSEDTSRAEEVEHAEQVEAKRCRRGWSRSSRSSTVQSDILTPPPATPPTLPDVFEADLGGGGDGEGETLALDDVPEEKKLLAREPRLVTSLAPNLSAPQCEWDLELPPPPEGPAYMHQRTSFTFAGHLDNRTQWHLLHQAIVTYMVELKMSPLIVFRLDHTGPFRGLEQKHTEITIITCATWTNAFETDMQDLIRMVWHGGDRQIEVHRLPVAA